MPRVVFTSNLQRHVACPEAAVRGTTVREALDNVFIKETKMRGYVLDEQGDLRRHVHVYVSGRRAALSDAVEASSEIFVLQALTGG
ncbi:MAG TPA: MoaD/ThiS family protein [Burkholderiales bacterium]